MSEKPKMETPWQFEVCGECGRKNIAAFRVTDAMWDRVVGRDGVLCIWCFDQFAAEKDIDWTREPIEFYPLSTVANRRYGAIEQYPRGNE